MKESSKESKERKAAAVAEEKTLKEKAATTSRAGRAHEECTQSGKKRPSASEQSLKGIAQNL